MKFQCAAELRITVQTHYVSDLPSAWHELKWALGRFPGSSLGTLEGNLRPAATPNSN